jgi:cephalosporin-C deacetylase
MPSIDMPLEQLRQYKPSLYREDDFESFWDSTIDAAVAQPLNAELIPFDLPARDVQSYALRYDGFENGRIGGWYLRPKATGKFPGVVSYHGYGGRGARPLDLLALAAQGVCVLSMDVRGQPGQSQDATVVDAGHVGGWMTKGIRDPKKYFFRYVYADAVRALELLARREEVDESRLAITGASQGGAITIAVSALSDRPILSLPDVPFLCDFRRAIEITPLAPYTEIASYLKMYPDEYARVIRTLSYVDNMNLAPWVTCRTVVCNNLWDDICPPSTVFAAYNHMTCEKQIEIFPYHKHDVPYERNESRHRLLMETLRP